MKKLLALLLFAAATFASPVLAQTTYPTPAGSRVNGVVSLTCDAAGINCAPASAAAPEPVADSGAVDGVTIQQTISSATSGASFSTVGYGSVSLQVQGNASGNTILVQGSNDGGTTWSARVLMMNFTTTSAATSTIVASTSSTTVGATYMIVGVQPLMRVTVSAYVGGTTTVAIGLKRNVPPGVLGAYVMNTSLAATLMDSAGTAYAPLTPVKSTSAAATSLVAKSTPGTYFDFYCQSTVAGRCILYNATSVPGAGALTAALVLDCAVVALGGQGGAQYGEERGRAASVGMVVLFSSSTDCNTYTASSTAYIHASVQ